jgi:hypothetical protein
MGLTDVLGFKPEYFAVKKKGGCSQFEVLVVVIAPRCDARLL